MSPPPAPRARWSLALVLMLAGCSPSHAPRHVSTMWLAGHPMPRFDPDGPPDALRQALERQLSRGLLDVDTTGRVTLALADSLGCTSDSMTWTFHLRSDARFTDGTRVTSAHVRDAMLAGLGRPDHATREWLLAAVRGMPGVRAGRPLPPLGIETAGERRLVLRLAVRDARLLEKLAVPGVSTPWKHRSGDWLHAVGVGPFRVGGGDAERALVLVSAGPCAGARAGVDTLRVRFLGGAQRVRNILRRSGADLLWPLPAGFLDAGVPSGWQLASAPARPERRLLLILRPDVPPLGQLEIRESLARATSPAEVANALDGLAEPLKRLVSGTSESYAWPRLEPAERSPRPERAAPARISTLPQPESHHVVLAFDADQPGAAAAPTLQGAWAAAGDYAELRPLHGPAALAQPLLAAGTQATLVEAQAPFPGLEAELAMLVAPLRGPARGGFRTGWRTREFDRWILPPGSITRLDPDVLERRLEADRIVLPLATLPWRVALRTNAYRPALHPRYGPDWTVTVNTPSNARTR